MSIFLITFLCVSSRMRHNCQNGGDYEFIKDIYINKARLFIFLVVVSVCWLLYQVFCNRNAMKLKLLVQIHFRIQPVHILPEHFSFSLGQLWPTV